MTKIRRDHLTTGKNYSGQLVENKQIRKTHLLYILLLPPEKILILACLIMLSTSTVLSTKLVYKILFQVFNVCYITY